MKKYLIIAACLGFLGLGGCSRCDMWGWYPPCDLIEGRAQRTCGPCGPCYQPGQVVSTQWAVPMEPSPAAEAPIVVEAVEVIVIEEEVVPPAE